MKGIYGQAPGGTMPGANFAAKIGLADYLTVTPKMIESIK